MRCALEAAAVRVAPSMNAQDVANTVWALATLGWQAGEGSMRCALEGAAVRVAPSMNAQNVANTLWSIGKRKFGLPDLHVVFPGQHLLSRCWRIGRRTGRRNG
jgi:transposase InsO family protein